MRANHRFALCAGVALALGGALLPGASASDRPSTARGPKLLPPARIDVPVAETGYQNPSAIVDLRDDESAALVSAVWRYSDARPIKAQGHAAGPDLRASGAVLETFDIAPKAGTKDFDDSAFTVIRASTLDARRGNGKLSFAWYRLHLTLPERLGDTPVRGARVELSVVVDDYAEVWVDGILRKQLGQRGAGLVSGFNAENRVVLSEAAEPGKPHVVAVFAANGPLSAAPDNFLWLRDASLEVFAQVRTEPPPSMARLTHKTKALEALLDANARVERVAGGLQFAEGPVWSRDQTLLFSDPNANRIYSYSPRTGLSVFRSHSGYGGVDVGRYHQPGSNGLGLDREGGVIAAEHGRRRVTRTAATGAITVLADRYRGKRLNSPNDLVVKSDGSVYFTDPPFGLPGVFGDPAKELPFSGVYRVANGELTLLDDSLAGPNGIAFSPDERTLYVTNWDPKHKIVKAWDVRDDGSVHAPRVFFDMKDAPFEEALDGLEVDLAGNLYVSGPGGVWILSPRGEHLGTLEVAELPANFAWGDDGKTLYMTARTSLYKLRTRIGGKLP